MNHKNKYYPESKFGGFSNVDGTIAFYQRVNALIRPSGAVVDIGCGRGAYGEDPIEYRRQLRILKGKCRQVIGIDVNPKARENPYVDEFRLIEHERWPVADGLADVCVSDNVLEHIPDPDHFFSESYRILRPGGALCIRTPNVFSYFGLISRLVPNDHHTAVLGRAKDRVVEEDVFPTLYRCNTIWGLRQMLEKHGFTPCVYGYDAEPSYLSFSRFAYFFGVLHQKYAPGFLKVGIHAFAQKR